MYILLIYNDIINIRNTVYMYASLQKNLTNFSIRVILNPHSIHI